MDAQEARRTVARLREIYRRGKRFEVTVGGCKLTITATERVELAFVSEAEVRVRNLTDGGEAGTMRPPIGGMGVGWVDT